jgi:hypothetical protein
MQRLEVSSAVRHVYDIRRQSLNLTVMMVQTAGLYKMLIPIC